MVSVDLLLVNGDTRHLSLAPSAIEVGSVRLGAWQVHPVDPPPVRFPGQAAYLVRASFDLVTAPDMVVPPWFEVGFAFDGDGTPVVLDAVPRSSLASAPPRNYRVDRNMSLVEISAPDPEAVHLPGVLSPVTVYDAEPPVIRWRHTCPHPGSHTAWFVLLVAAGVTSVGVTAFAHYDLPLSESFGYDPATRSRSFDLDLVPTPATPVAHTVPARGPVAEKRRRPRVFICYAHDDSEHLAKVLEFAKYLVGVEDIEVVIDRWRLDVARDWPLWAVREMRTVDFVLVIASPLCKKVGDGDTDDDHNRGLQAEMGLIRDAMYREPSRAREKYLSVVLPGRSLDEIPDLLQPAAATRFVVASFTREGAELLLRTLTGQPRDVPPPRPDHVPPFS